MSASIPMAGRRVLAAVAVASLACLGAAVPAMASSRTGPGLGSVSPARAAAGAAQADVIRASAVRAAAARAGGRAVPGFASGNIPTARAGLGGISCPAASFCMAVGGDTKGPLAEVWNGRTWRAIPGPPGGAGAVSCASARLCMDSNGTRFERWDGRRWTAAPAPADLTFPTGISCAGASFCMTVGLSNNITGGGQDGCMTGAVWRGTAWHTVAIPFGNCGVDDFGLGPVSCASASDCVAVGTQDGPEHTQDPLALGWNGKTWRLLGNPPSSPDTTLGAVSCATSGSFCMVLGNGSDGDLAVGWDGTTWTELGPPPSSVGSLSCASAHSCAAVRGGQPVTWDGVAWAAQTISRPGGASFGGVSCWHPAECMAAGSYSRIALPGPLPGGPGGAQLTLAAEWNGSTWQVRRTPSPDDEQEGLSGVSCRSAANCMAVGAFVNGSDVQAALAERWNGRAWTVLAAPDPGAGENVLTAVSCPAARQCIAVGYFDTAGDHQALAEQWNGSTWTTLTVPHDGVLNGVSCPAVNDCVAVGSYVPPGQQAPLALSATWNGSTWTVQASPDPGGQPAELNAISCPSRTRCIAVGDYRFALGLQHPLTALWNATTWTTLTTRAPGGANGWNTLTSVSCSRPRTCMAVGTTFHLPGLPFHPQTLAESWNGTRWTARPTPKLNSQLNAYLDAVSCPASARCRAAGGYFTSSGTGFVLAEAWNGATWRRLVPLTDPGPAFNTLYAISCPAIYRCIAVGGTAIQHTLAYLWNGTRWQRLHTPNP